MVEGSRVLRELWQTSEFKSVLSQALVRGHDLYVEVQGDGVADLFTATRAEMLEALLATGATQAAHELTSRTGTAVVVDAGEGEDLYVRGVGSSASGTAVLQARSN